MQTLPHMHLHQRTQTHTHTLAHMLISRPVVSLYLLHTYTHIHLFTMVMTCSRERTSVARRPCWDSEGLHANPIATNTRARTHSLTWSYVTASIEIPPDKHSLAKRRCLVRLRFSMLLFNLALLPLIGTVSYTWLSTAKIMNGLERTHLLSFAPEPSLRFIISFFFSSLPQFPLAFPTVIPITANYPSFCFCWKRESMNVNWRGFLCPWFVWWY